MAVRYVSLSPREACDRISEALTGRYLSATEVTSHVTRLAGGGETVIGVFERYSFRNSNRMSMSVVCSPSARDRTEVFFVASGASSGFFGLFDYGAAEDFESVIDRALAEHLVREGD